MTKSAWQRTGAFVGTVVATALVAKTVSPNSSTRAIEALGKSFSNTLGAAIGKEVRAGRDNPSVAQYQRGGKSSVNIQAAGDVHIRSLREDYQQDLDEIIARNSRPMPVPYFWAGIYHRALALFPQVPTPFQRETWEQAACRIYNFVPETWEDAETLAELVHEMKCECGTDGI